MATLETALALASRAHTGTLDKGGEPCILHPLRVMAGVTDPDAKIVAILHDVVEDTDVTMADLRTKGFSSAVLTAVELLTHRPEQSYADYVIACKADPLARQVKMADLRDNANLDRLLLRPKTFDKDSARMHRYVLSYRYLADHIPEADYRALMVRLERGIQGPFHSPASAA